MTSPPRSSHVVALIARHEFSLRVRGKVFGVGTAIAVALLAVYVVLQLTVLDRIDTTTQYHVGFTTDSASLVTPLRAAGDALGVRIVSSSVSDAASGDASVRDGSLDALVTGAPQAPRVVVRSELSTQLRTALTTVVRQEALDARLQSAGLDPAQVQQQVASARFSLSVLQPVAPNSVEGPAIGAVLALLLYTFLGIYGTLVAQSVVAEKASRVVEILLATVRARDLLLGKVIGVGMAAVLQFGVILCAALALTLPTHILVVPATAIGAVLGGVLWFVLGYLLYAVLLAGAAALVSRVEEVTAATLPVTLLLVAGWLLAYAVFIPEITAAASGSVVSSGVRDLGTITSLVPFFSPILMPIRMAAGDAPVWQWLLGVVITLGTVLLMSRLAGRMYYNSVLRFGARVRVRDALR